MAGRKPYEPTDKDRRQVEAASGYGLTHERIAALIGIDPKTLRKHFRTELDVGAAKADAAVANSLFENATKHNNVAAQIWWSKARMGWTDKLTIEHSGAVETKQTIDPTKLSTAALREVLAARAQTDE